MMKRRTFVFAQGLLLLLLFVAMGLFFGNPFTFSVTGYSIGEIYSSEVLYTLHAVSGEETRFVIPLENTLSVNLTEVYATIAIYSLDEVLLTTITTDTINLSEGEKTQIDATWKNNVLAGTYIAQIYLHTSESDANFVKRFTIEQPTISIVNIFAEEFALGDPVNLSILVENHLPVLIENAQAHLLVYDETGEIIAEVVSDEEMIDSLSIESIRLVWDTRNLASGNYNSQLVVGNSEYSITKDLVISLSQDFFSVSGVGFSINYANTVNTNMGMIILGAIILLLLVNVLLWILFVRGKK